MVLDVAQHRRDQAFLGGDGDRDVGVAVVDHVGAVDRGIDHRIFLQRVGGGLGEEAHEAELDAVGLLERLAEFLAHRHHLAEVDLVERGQHGDGILRLHHALGDALADAGHRHALFRTRAAGRGRAAGLDVVDQVFLGHLVVATGAGDVGRIDLVGLGDEAAGRRQVRRVGLGAAAGSGFSRERAPRLRRQRLEPRPLRRRRSGPARRQPRPPR